MLLLNPRHSVEERNSHRGRKITLIHLVDVQQMLMGSWNRSHYPLHESGTRGTESVTSPDMSVGEVVGPWDTTDHGRYTAKSTANISASSICPCRCILNWDVCRESPSSCHLPVAESPNAQSYSAASWALAEVNGLSSLQDWAFC